MSKVGVGTNVAVGMAGVELGGIGLGVKVAVGLIVDTGVAIPQAVKKITRMIIEIASIFFFIQASPNNI
jgi:hypothetical protein